MYRTALRNVLAHKGRLLMTVLAVLLGTAFVAGTLVFTDTLGSALKSQNAKSYTDIAVSVTDDGAVSNGYQRGDRRSSAPLTEQTRQRIAALPGAAEARGVVSGFAGVADHTGSLIGNGFSTTGTNYVPGKDGQDARYPLAEGRGPQQQGELALDARTAAKGGYRIGDTVRVAVNGPVMQLRLTGTLHVNDPRVNAGGSLAAFDTATAQRLYLAPGQFNEIDVAAKPGTEQSTLLGQVRQLLPSDGDFTAQTGTELQADQDRQIASATKNLSSSLLVFAGISLFVGVFIIANTFTMLVAQRTKELALLRAVGASRRQITRSVLVEALLVGLLASAAGLAAGTGIAAGLRWVLNGPGDANLPDGPLIVAPSTVLTAFAVGVLVTVAAAWLPARRASRIAPVAAMSNGDQPATPKSLLLRNTIGAVISAVGLGLLLLGSSSHATNTVGLGAAALLLGVFVLTPLLSRPLIALLAPVLQKFYGSPGKLARENALRNPRRTAATASALTVGVTLITALTVVGASVNRAVDQAAGTDLKADYAVAMQNFAQLAPEVGPQIAKAPGVAASSVLRQVPVEDGSRTRWVTGVDPQSIGALATLNVTGGSPEALGKGQLLVSRDYADKNGLAVGSTLRLSYPDSSSGTLTVGGLFAANSVVDGLVVADSVLAPHSAGQGPDRVLVKGTAGATAALKQALKDATGGNPLIAVKGQADLKKENREMVNAALSIMYGLLGMSVVIAVLGVVNTMAMSVFERRREIGMLRAVGLDRRGVRRMVRLESLLIALLGGVLGVGLGILTAWAGNGTIAGSFKDLTTVIPPLPILGFVAAAALVGLAAAIWPARRASRLDMLESINAG
ncbi:ABC transporter permease [Kitasatospora azatica]|uniref:ABC transporter permease n=1 Tax=Kitasatospora azatica TaxID=58347 RepID=UPI00055A5547|nr:ABC transporter permease [Kitasatospora azatica]